MDKPEKLATHGTQDQKKTKRKHNAICVGHHYALTNTNDVNKTKLRTQRHIIEQHTQLLVKYFRNKKVYVNNDENPIFF
jgi:hypothetical protein